MNLALDLGNTRAKAVFFDNDTEVAEYVYDKFTLDDCKALLRKHDTEAAILCAVTAFDEALPRFLRDNTRFFMQLAADTPQPLEIDYCTPQTLGADRLAAATAAACIKPGRNILVIDAGTALTFDLVTADGRFAGGNISPGARLRFKALNAFTGKLPLLSLEECSGGLGKSTKEAILNGVVQGIVSEIGHYAESLSAEYEDLLVFLTGGDCFYFAKKLKIPIFVVPNLLSQGLNRILKYNLCRKSAL